MYCKQLRYPCHPWYASYTCINHYSLFTFQWMKFKKWKESSKIPVIIHCILPSFVDKAVDSVINSMEQMDVTEEWSFWRPHEPIHLCCVSVRVCVLMCTCCVDVRGRGFIFHTLQMLHWLHKFDTGFCIQKKNPTHTHFFCISKYTKCLTILHNVCHFIIIKGLLSKMLLLSNSIAKYSS